jgi:cysteine desulfuration protein SufE
MPPLAALLDDLKALDDWESRYGYVIDLGRRLPPMAATAMTEPNRVRGCTSAVYLTLAWQNGTLDLALASDALIVSGLLAIIRAAYQGRTRAEALALDLPALLEPTNLLTHLSPNRRNGFASVLARINHFLQAA